MSYRTYGRGILLTGALCLYAESARMGPMAGGLLGLAGAIFAWAFVLVKEKP